MDKKLIRYGIILAGILIVIVIFSLLLNTAKGGTKLSYDKIEEKLVSAARRYVKNKEASGMEILPDSYLADSYYLSADVLVNEGYIKDLSSYSKDKAICSGGVNIYNAGDGNYDYVPELACGSYYETVKLSDVVIKDNNGGVTHGSGLYLRVNGNFILKENELNIGSDNYEYVFRGDDVNNVVLIGDNYWRIVSIDNNGNLLLIAFSRSQKTFAWDDKYNEIVKRYQGVNDFENNGLESNIYKVLKDFRNGTVNLINREKISDSLKYLEVPMTLCVGKRNAEDKDISGKAECKTTLENQFVGLLPAYYFMSASLDSGCDTIYSKSCGNYNYLSSFNDYWWLLTADSEATNQAYFVMGKYAGINVCSYKAYLRPTVKIGGRAIYGEGDGSMDNPYTIKFYGE